MDGQTLEVSLLSHEYMKKLEYVENLSFFFIHFNLMKRMSITKTNNEWLIVDRSTFYCEHVRNWQLSFWHDSLKHCFCRKKIKMTWYDEIRENVVIQRSVFLDPYQIVKCIKQANFIFRWTNQRRSWNFDACIWFMYNWMSTTNPIIFL